MAIFPANKIRFVLFFLFTAFLSSHYSIDQHKTVFLPRGLSLSVQDGNRVAVDIIRFDQCRKTILVLPGYRFHRSRWLKNSRLKKLAEKKRYCLILPEMGRSIYESRFFAGSMNKEFEVPTIEWLKKIFFPYIRNDHHLLMRGKKNFLLGLSTGARGVALIHLHFKNTFIAGAALSGDYDQREMPYDRLMSNIYGPYEKFPERRRIDNPVIMAEKWNMPLYLSHGRQDEVVPWHQTDLFYNALIDANKHHTLQIIMKITDDSHNFSFWDRELDDIFNFFEKFT